MPIQDIHQSYANRFDIEHFFSFGKKKLLLNSYQTCEVEHFDNWLILVQLAYWMLYSARSLGQQQWYPWEKYNYQSQTSTAPPQEGQAPILSPIQTKRSFDRIIEGFEHKPVRPKPRNNSSGRKKDGGLGLRPRHKVRKKAEYRALQDSNNS